MGAGGLTAAGGPAPVPPLGALWPGLGSDAAPALVGTSSVAYRKVFISSFQTMLKTIFLFMFSTRIAICSQQDSYLTLPLWLR